MSVYVPMTNGLFVLHRFQRALWHHDARRTAYAHGYRRKGRGRWRTAYRTHYGPDMTRRERGEAGGMW